MNKQTMKGAKSIKHKMDDGTVVDTDLSQKDWPEAMDGKISRNTGHHWAKEHLYQSAKGRFYVQRTSTRTGGHSTARFVTEKEAAAWLVLNDHKLPPDLEEIARSIIE